MSQTDKLLNAVDAVKGIEKEQDKIELLDSLGFRTTEIARLLNKSPENVSVQLGNIRKKKEPKTAQPKEKGEAKQVEQTQAKLNEHTPSQENYN